MIAEHLQLVANLLANHLQPLAISLANHLLHHLPTPHCGVFGSFAWLYITAYSVISAPRAQKAEILGLAFFDLPRALVLMVVGIRHVAQAGDNRFTPKMITAIDAIMGMTMAGALTRFNLVVNILVECRLAYRRTLKVGEFLVHPKNRGGIGINAHNSHKTLRTVKQIGGNRKQLTMATAFETTPLGQEQENELASNRKWIEDSNELMAPISGDEKFLTVSCPHWTQGCRSVKAGCKTPSRRFRI